MENERDKKKQKKEVKKKLSHYIYNTYFTYFIPLLTDFDSLPLRLPLAYCLLLQHKNLVDQNRHLQVSAVKKREFSGFTAIGFYHRHPDT